MRLGRLVAAWLASTSAVPLDLTPPERSGGPRPRRGERENIIRPPGGDDTGLKGALCDCPDGHKVFVETGKTADCSIQPTADDAGRLKGTLVDCPGGFKVFSETSQTSETLCSFAADDPAFAGLPGLPTTPTTSPCPTLASDSTGEASWCKADALKSHRRSPDPTPGAGCKDNSSYVEGPFKVSRNTVYNWGCAQWKKSTCGQARLGEHHSTHHIYDEAWANCTTSNKYWASVGIVDQEKQAAKIARLIKNCPESCADVTPNCP